MAKQNFHSSGRALLASTLALAAVTAQLPVEAFAAGGRKPAALPVDRTALVLERFTFGPRPGDLELARKEGIDRWFERQLSPEKIDDSALERRLDIYPALHMTQAQRMERYPQPSVVRQMAKNGVRLPADPEARAILLAQVEFYQARREQQAKQKAEDAAMGSVMATPAMPMDNTMQTASANTAEAAVAKGADGKPLPLDQTVAAMPKADVDALLQTPADARYQRILGMTPEQLVALRKGSRGQEQKLAEGMTLLQKETLLALAGTNRLMTAEADGSRLLRDIYSERQLEAVMTDFWLNHFNVYDRKNGNMPALLPEYEETVRRHALGHFEDLLVATATSPAMMLYLDNATSTGPDSQAAQGPQRRQALFARPGAFGGGFGGMRPAVANAQPKKANVGLNENYARELMELHTLGVNGGYTQHDVTEVAKVFTGWTLERPGDGGEFVYNDRRHEPGSKTVLGQTIKEHGQQEGFEVLHLLATSPATAHFISTKLAQRFVSDDPSPALVNRMAQTFLSSHGDTKAVLRTMYRSPEFNAPATVHSKLKTPLEYVVSAARVSGADVQNPAPLVQALERLGMPLYGAQPPTGYKWNADTWLSTSALVNRMNFALTLSTNRIGGTSIDWTGVVSGNAKAAPAQPATPDAAALDAAAKEQRLERTILDAPASEQTRNTVLAQATDALAQKAASDFHASATAKPVAGSTGAEQVAMNTSLSAAKREPGQRGNGRGLGAAPAALAPPPTDKEAAAMAGLLIGSPEFQRR